MQEYPSRQEDHAVRAPEATIPEPARQKRIEEGKVMM
jgi:hypothetical protein